VRESSVVSLWEGGRLPPVTGDSMLQHEVHGPANGRAPEHHVADHVVEVET
jgi:hypothetical protein